MTKQILNEREHGSSDASQPPGVRPFSTGGAPSRNPFRREIKAIASWHGRCSVLLSPASKSLGVPHVSTDDLTDLSRRRFLALAVSTAAAASGVLPTPTRAADLPHLAETDAAAQALGYREDTRKVPSAKYPNHQPAQECGKCNLYKGAAGAQWGPCLIFPGKDVRVQGWCSAFTPRQ
ncbi:MAG: high-potential iron-sulfur protein [Burkholderiales bacterium]